MKVRARPTILDCSAEIPRARSAAGRASRTCAKGIESGFQKTLGGLDKTIKRFTGQGDDDDDGGTTAADDTGDDK